MADFSITHTAFSGFRFAREKPMVIAIWFVLSLIVGFGQAFLTVTMVGDTMVQLQAVAAHPDPSNPMAVFSLLGRLIPFYALSILIAMVVFALTTGAATRSALRPDQQGFGYLSFGGDELRLMVVALVIGVIMFVVYMVGLIFASIIAGIGSVAMGQRPAPGSIPAAYFTLLGLGALPMIVALLTLAVKFSLASAQTVDSRTISIFGSWGVTKGHFWKLVGTYLLSALLFLPVAALGLAVMLGAAVILGGGVQAAQGLMRPDLSSVAAYFTPLRIIFLMIVSLYNALGFAIFLRTPAVIYAQLTDRAHEEVF